MKIELKDLEFFTLNDFSYHEVIREIAAVVLSGSDTDKEITIDHIIPLSKGGTNELGNLQFLCHSCNSKKSAKYEASC